MSASTMYIIGFNGPPRSGKDTIAKMLQDHLCQKSNLPTLIKPLSMPLRKMAFGALGMEYDVEIYERIKDQPIAALNGVTLRQFMIQISEDWMKQSYGSGIFPKLLLESIPIGFDGIVLVPDCGFQLESHEFTCAVGSQYSITVQVHREGKSFDGDSREWVESDTTYLIHNNGSLDDARTEAVRIYGRLVNQLGWRL